MLTIVAVRMKGKKDHAVPLTAAALAIIGTRRSDARTRPFVFSTTAGMRTFSGFSKAKAALMDDFSGYARTMAASRCRNGNCTI